MDCTEGVHKPLGKYIFNNVQFSTYDPVIPLMREAGYKVMNHPTDPTGVLVTFPVEWKDVPFHKENGTSFHSTGNVTKTPVGSVG